MRRLPTLASLLSAASILLVSAEASAGVPPPPTEPAGTTQPTGDPAAGGTAGGTVGGTVGGSAGGTAGGDAWAVPPAPGPEPTPAPEVEPAPEPPVGDGVHGAGPEASAMKGKFGIGGIRTLAGVTGINARYFVADRFSLGLNFGFATFTYKEPDPDDPMDYRRRNVAALGANIEALFWAKIGQPGGNLPFRADFGVGGRVGFAHIVNATDVGDDLDDPLELQLEIPLAFQLMFGENFALVPEIGAAVRWLPGDREPDSDGDADTNPGLVPPQTGIMGASPGPGFSFQMGNNGAFGLMLGGGLEYYF